MEASTLQGGLLQVPEGWLSLEDSQPVEGSETLTLYLALKQQNLENLYELLEQTGDPQSPQYGQWSTREELNKLLQPSAQTEQVVFGQWLSAALPLLSVERPVQDWAKVSGPVSVLAPLLGNPRLVRFLHQASGQRVIRALDGYRLPAAVAPHLDFVGGLLRFPRFESLLQQGPYRGQPAQPFIFDFKTTPAAIWSRYNVTVSPPSPNNLQAVASFLQQYFSPSDLRQAQLMFNQTANPISQLFGYNDASNPGTEAELDVQYLMGVSNSVITTWVYSTNGTTSSGNEPFLDWLNFLLTQSQLPYVFSISYQDYENTVDPDYATRVCAEFARITQTGRTFFTGSGDWGVGGKNLGNGPGSFSCTKFNADFPSSCPYVVSLGSTTFQQSLSGNVEEIGIDFSSGGFSNYFSRPSYQDKAVSLYLSSATLPPQSYWNATGRAFPDLAIIGNKFQVVQGGRVIPVGGTSASTPTFAAFISMINSVRLNAQQPTMGYVHPFLYQSWASAATAFHDITQNQQQEQGCTGHSFGCTVGYDAMSGLGVPNFKILLQLATSPSFIPALQN